MTVRYWGGSLERVLAGAVAAFPGAWAAVEMLTGHKGSEEACVGPAVVHMLMEVDEWEAPEVVASVPGVAVLRIEPPGLVRIGWLEVGRTEEHYKARDREG